MSCNGWSVKSRASSSHQKGAVHELHSTSLPRLQLQLIFVNLSLFQHITLTIDSRLTFIYDHGYSGVSKASGNFKKKTSSQNTFPQVSGSSSGCGPIPPLFQATKRRKTHAWMGEKIGKACRSLSKTCLEHQTTNSFMEVW